ncbi:MAG: hypothetical protein AB3X46_03695 [Leptothrix ochracea]|uniref:hypothetical protein n=1 Tax=Leptothrix ochracea TaxID=735331 RepID=UPI0034E1FAD9
MTTAPRSHGSATLGLVLVLLTSLALMIVYAHQAQWAEMRGAAHGVRGLMAFEAAEAGRAWGSAMLAASTRLNSACQPETTAGATALSFRQRLLRFNPATGRHQAAQTNPSQPACLMQGGSWQCACPDQGSATLALPDPNLQDGDHPAFSVRIAALASPAPAGQIELISTGCANPALGCGGDQTAEAQAQVKIVLAPVGSLRLPPQAPLSAGANIEIHGPAALINTDPQSMGLTLDAGGDIQLETSVQLMGLPGSPPQASVLAFDSGLQNPAAGTTPTPPPNLLTSDWPLRLFGLPGGSLVKLPHWSLPACAGGICDASATQTALDQGASALWLRGDVRLTGPLTVGRADQPVILVVDGHLQLQGEVHIHGFILTQRLSWRHPGTPTSTPATLDGAAVVQSDALIDGRIVMSRDPTVLQRLQLDAGTWVMLPGRWRDHEP